MSKKYFINYSYRYMGGITKHTANLLIDKHPVQWLAETSERDTNTDYTLLFWEEIPEQIYQAYKDKNL